MAWPNNSRADNYVVLTSDWNGAMTALREWGGDVDGGGYELSNVRVHGQLQLWSAAEPTADASSRGTLAFVAGGSGVADSLRVCLKDGTGAYVWVSLV